MKRCFVLALLLAGCSKPAVTGDPVRKAPETKVANRQVASDPAPLPPKVTHVTENVTDVTEFEHCIADLADACEYRMAGRYQRANARVRSAMEQEIARAQAGRGSSAAERSHEMKRIGDASAELVDNISRGNQSAMEKNLELAREFLSLMRADAGATVASRREDKGERR